VRYVHFDETREHMEVRTFANTEKKVSCGGNSEISSAAKETTLNTLIIAASLQTRPSWSAVMDTSDHYTDASFSVPRVSLGASKTRACIQSVLNIARIAYVLLSYRKASSHSPKVSWTCRIVLFDLDRRIESIEFGRTGIKRTQ